MSTKLPIVNEKTSKYLLIGNRLREERERLGYNQADFAAIGGATRKTQYNYEAGERAPDVGFLAAIAAAKADVHYILTGEDPQQHMLAAIKASSKKVADLPLVNECKAAIAQLLVGLQTDKMDLITDALDIIRSDYVGLGEAKGALPAMQDYAGSNLTVVEKDLLAAYRQAAQQDQAFMERLAQFAAQAAKEQK